MHLLYAPDSICWVSKVGNLGESWLLMVSDESTRWDSLWEGVDSPRVVPVEGARVGEFVPTDLHLRLTWVECQ